MNLSLDSAASASRSLILCSCCEISVCRMSMMSWALGGEEVRRLSSKPSEGCVLEAGVMMREMSDPSDAARSCPG